MLESEGVLVASRKAMEQNPTLLAVIKEVLERLEANLEAKKYYTVTGNMKGASAREVADRLLATDGLAGLTGPTVAPVYTKGPDGSAVESPDVFAAVISVPKDRLYPAVKAIRRAGGSGVLVSPMTYIFDEETPRWKALLDTLGADAASVPEL